MALKGMVGSGKAGDQVSKARRTQERREKNLFILVCGQKVIKSPQARNFEFHPFKNGVIKLYMRLFPGCDEYPDRSKRVSGATVLIVPAFAWGIVQFGEIG